MLLEPRHPMTTIAWDKLTGQQPPGQSSVAQQTLQSVAPRSRRIRWVERLVELRVWGDRVLLHQASL